MGLYLQLAFNIMGGLPNPSHQVTSLLSFESQGIGILLSGLFGTGNGSSVSVYVQTNSSVE